MGADLSLGRVERGCIVCPLHGWEYGTDGRCKRIPAGEGIPPFAQQLSFPAEEHGGHVFFFNRPNAYFPFPSFTGVNASDLHAARPFEFRVQAPWHLVSGNGFDVQHFRSAHDRTLLGEPMIDSRHPFARQIRARFRVTGTTLRDRLTRSISGAEVEMTVENWGGNLVLVTARFPRATTYGIVSFIPVAPNLTVLRNLVLVRRSKNLLARRLWDPLVAAVRRSFIREFVRADVVASAGIRFYPKRMIAVDNVLVEYLGWLHKLPR